jgi:hypothetical protein
VFHVALMEPAPADSALSNEEWTEADDDEYEVEKILDYGKVKGRWSYLVKWKGYSNTHNSWQQKLNLQHCQLKIKQYHQRHPEIERMKNSLEQGRLRPRASRRGNQKRNRSEQESPTEDSDLDDPTEVRRILVIEKEEIPESSQPPQRVPTPQSQPARLRITFFHEPEEAPPPYEAAASLETTGAAYLAPPGGPPPSPGSLPRVRTSRPRAGQAVLKVELSACQSSSLEQELEPPEEEDPVQRFNESVKAAMDELTDDSFAYLDSVMNYQDNSENRLHHANIAKVGYIKHVLYSYDWTPWNRAFPEEQFGPVQWAEWRTRHGQRYDLTQAPMHPPDSFGAVATKHHWMAWEVLHEINSQSRSVTNKSHDTRERTQEEHFAADKSILHSRPESRQEEQGIGIETEAEAQSIRAASNAEDSVEVSRRLEVMTEVAESSVPARNLGDVPTVYMDGMRRRLSLRRKLARERQRGTRD